ncbi:MAG: hypothetical protein IPM56_05090 [Ignavibacteriales bacterium]|nr:MAG: hypothetical protein IPM56_05090 [Ignavibacteriales bacterium]
MKKIAIILFTVFGSFVFAQEYSRLHLDSIYAEYLSIKAPHLLTDKQLKIIENTGTIKCAFGTVNFVRMNKNLFDAEQQNQIEKITQRTPKQTSIVSPNGFFRIHFNTTGNDIPRYNIAQTPLQNAQLVAQAFDSSYTFEVNYLGYPPPPLDDTSGGDNLYDVYINELGSGLYGYTEYESETSPGSGKLRSFIVIDNDYVGSFATNGIDGARVTAAHEFHHAIQGGNYIFRDADRFFYEITSTAMEEFVYDSINDYYAYMNSYFNNPGNSFANNNGYNLAVWNIYLRDSYGYDVLKRQWELMPQLRALNAIYNSLSEIGTSLRTEFNKFGIWTFYTRSRRIPGMYFEEAAAYPLIRTGTPLTFTPPADTINGSSYGMANNFITLINPNASPQDTFVVLISNSDADRGINGPNLSVPYSYILSVDSIEGSIKLSPGYYAFFQQNDPQNWAVSEFLNRQLVREDSSIILLPIEVNEFVFPNPFVYNKAGHTEINLTLSGNINEEVDLNVYSSAMELVYESTKQIRSFGEYRVINWNGLDNSGKKLASGVYIYAIRKGDDIYKGKLVIFHD